MHFNVKFRNRTVSFKFSNEITKKLKSEKGKKLKKIVIHQKSSKIFYDPPICS